MTQDTIDRYVRSALLLLGCLPPQARLAPQLARVRAARPAAVAAPPAHGPRR